MAEEIRDCGVIEAHLAPYIDGEEGPSMRESIAAHLAACPPCRKLADAESEARQLVHTHRGGLQAAAPEALRVRCSKLSPFVPAQSSRFVRRWMPLSLAASLLLAVAAALLYSVNNPLEALAASLAMDHTTCFKIAGTDRHADSEAEAKAWQQEEGWAIEVPRDLPSEQLQLVDVRNCLSSTGRAAHLLYTYRGSPLSVYVMPKDNGHAGATIALGRDAVVWCAKGRTYAVVADGHPQDLTRIVDYMKANVK